MWCDVFLKLADEQQIVRFRKENALFIVTPVVDMIYGVGLESHGLWVKGVPGGPHGFSPGRTLYTVLAACSVRTGIPASAPGL